MNDNPHERHQPAIYHVQGSWGCPLDKRRSQGSIRAMLNAYWQLRGHFSKHRIARGDRIWIGGGTPCSGLLGRDSRVLVVACGEKNAW